MNLRTPRRIATVGGVLISISGVVNALLGVRIDALIYEVYPGGRMGHVGIISGVIALVLGLIIVVIVAPLYDRKSRSL